MVISWVTMSVVRSGISVRICDVEIAVVVVPSVCSQLKDYDRLECGK